MKHSIHNTLYTTGNTQLGFTLVEVLIVVAIIGILAAIVVPTFQDNAQSAKESAAKDNLRILRNAIEIYTAQHNDTPPGYPNGNSSATPHYSFFLIQIVASATNASGQAGGAISTPDYPFGPYLKTLPENPFNSSTFITVISNSGSFPVEATGDFGWIYKPATKEIRLDWPGTDNDGIRYYDY